MTKLVRLQSRFRGTAIAVAVVSGLVFGVPAASAAEDNKSDAGMDAAKFAEQIKAKIEVCASCHGADGKGTGPTFPNIGGQYEDYLYHTLKSYANGERDNAIMKGQVTLLNDAEMRGLAEYYSNQAPSVFTPRRGTWQE